MIFCFSGTGHSRFVAERLAELLDDPVIETIDLSTPAKCYHLERGERVVWVFPIHSWGLPPVVMRAIEGMTLEGGSEAPHFMVATCGDDAGLADKMWLKAIGQRGWTGLGAWTVMMPNTYIAMGGFNVDSQETVARKLSASAGRIREIAEGIRGAKPGTFTADVIRGALAWLKTRVIYPWFVARRITPRRFVAGDACTGCGLCADNCPLGRIEMRDRKPTWKAGCALCLRCLHSCPQRAIDWGKTTRDKERYIFRRPSAIK